LTDNLQASIVICTHNPRKDYLSKVLLALRQQTTPYDSWELLIVDNASQERVDAEFDVDWHPRARIVREDKIGLSHARLCGLKESKSDLLIFVDDDNVLNSDYVSEAVKIAEGWPILGTWGGQCIPQFEVRPNPKLQLFLGGLALRESQQDYWSNFEYWSSSHPYGAGICVRRSVAEQFADKVRKDSRRLLLGRAGKNLSAGDDFELNRTACRLGLGCGVFHALKLVHMIPANRVEEHYLRNLWRGITYSNYLIRFLDGDFLDARRTRSLRVVLRLLECAMRERSLTQLKFAWSCIQGERDAIKLIRELESCSAKPLK